MSIPRLLEVAVGLALVYYVLGLLVSFISGRIMEALETRGKDTEAYLRRVVGEARLAALLAQPQIRALKPVRYQGPLGVLTGRVKEARVEKVPVPKLVDAVFDLYGLADRSYSAAELTTLLAQLPDSEAKINLLWFVQQQVTSVEELRAKTALWLDGVMEQAADTYKAHARQVVIGLSILVTLLLGVDTLDFARQLWEQPELRAIANAQAEAYLAEQGAGSSVEPLLQNLDALSLRVGWWALPQQLPQSAGPWGWALWGLSKLLGLALTALAVSQGSSFWYDVLGRMKRDKGPGQEDHSS